MCFLLMHKHTIDIALLIDTSSNRPSIQMMKRPDIRNIETVNKNERQTKVKEITFNQRDEITSSFQFSKNKLESLSIPGQKRKLHVNFYKYDLSVIVSIIMS